MLIIIRMALLWVSIMGYCFYLRKKNVNMAFAPIITLCFIGSVMFIAGLLNIMPLATWLLGAGGFVCGIVSQPWHKDARLTAYDYVCLLVFSGITVLFGIRLHGEMLLGYDDFSHWLLVIRDMLRSDCMPNYRSELINFQGYPTGTAGFIYYGCKIIGSQREDVILFIQSWLYAASFCVFLAYVKRIRISAIILIIAASYCCLSANMPITELYVDSLLSVLMIASAAIIIYYRNDPNKAAIYSIPIQIFLVSVKNSGLMMLFNTMLLVYFIFRKSTTAHPSPRKNATRLALLHGGIPLFVFYLWNRHVKYVFTEGIVSQHTLAIENYMEHLKSFEDVQEILIRFIQRLFSLNKAWIFILIILFILVAGHLVRGKLCKQRGRQELMMGIGFFAIYLGYMAAVAAMYVFSMPIREALSLGSYGRYEKTVLVYLLGITIIYLLQLISVLPETKRSHIVEIGAVLLTTMMIVPMINSRYSTTLFDKQNRYIGSDRERLETIIEEHSIPTESTYIFYGSRLQSRAGYFFRLGKYLLETWEIRDETAESFDGNISGYQYLIVLDEDETIDAWLESNGFTPGEGAYELSQDSKE